jgi:hypothetical protein
MNDNDKNNLLFLMTLDSKSLNDWYIQADEDDRLYAEQLMAQAHLIAIDAAVAKLPRFNEAKKVLAQFAI